MSQSSSNCKNKNNDGLSGENGNHSSQITKQSINGTVERYRITRQSVKEHIRGVNREGKLIILFGPMFSGKTTHLINKLVTAHDVGHRVIYINHSLDNRPSYDDAASSHHSIFDKLPKSITATKTSTLSSIDVNEYDIIGIDEGQFFTDLESTVREWVLHNGKMVIIASLDGKADVTSFGQAHELICIAEKIKKLPAVCMNCMKDKCEIRTKPAYFTYRTTTDKGDVVIGGVDKYIAVCLSCHQKLTQLAQL